VTLDELDAIHVRHGANVPYYARVGAFTRIGAAELTALANAFALGPIRAHRAIAAGTINSNFELDCERGHLFLRVNEGKSEADVAWEARLVAALAARGVPTPPPIVARDGRPYAPLPDTTKLASVFPWRHGTHAGDGDITPQRAREFGAALAALHVAGLALPAEWRRASIYDHAHLVARHAGFAGSPDPALARAIAVLGDELAAAASAAAARGRATHGMIHGDLFRDNVLWDGDRITAILDFEQASGGSLVYDLAVCLNDWCWDERARQPRVELARALISAYEQVRPLTADDRAALPVEIRAAATRFTITRITDVYLANAINPEKDFRAFLARVDGWRGSALGEVASAY
jgi:homoserine kinase type II